MSFESAGYPLQPVLPELVLAVGAMVLLMVGAYREQGTTRLVTTLAICLLVLTGVLEWMLPAGKLTTFGGSFIVDDFARFLKILALIASASCSAWCSCWPGFASRFPWCRSICGRPMSMRARRRR